MKRPISEVPDVDWDELARRISGQRVVLFLDFDGTLSEIVDEPDDAKLADGMGAAIERASRTCLVSIVSGRGLDDVHRRVAIEGLTYAGSHGFEVIEADGTRRVQPEAEEFLPALDRAESALRERLAGFEGCIVERKRFALAVHYRKAAPGTVEDIARVVTEVAASEPGLRKSGGKMVFELRPKLDWNKGRLVLKLLDDMGDGQDLLPIYIGDDETDEDAFAAIHDRGIGVVVRGENDAMDVSAHYALQDVHDARAFIVDLATRMEQRA